MSCTCMSLSLLSAGLNVVPQLRVICDLRVTGDVVPEIGLSHIIDVNLEGVFVDPLVPHHISLANVIITVIF